MKISKLIFNNFFQESVQQFQKTQYTSLQKSRFCEWSIRLLFSQLHIIKCQHLKNILLSLYKNCSTPSEKISQIRFLEDPNFLLDLT